MQRLAQLRAQRQTQAVEFRAFLDGAIAAAQTAGGGLSAEDQTKKTGFETKLAQIDGLIAAQEQLAALAPAAPPVLEASQPGAVAAAAAQAVAIEMEPGMQVDGFGHRAAIRRATRVLVGRSSRGVYVAQPNIASDPMRGFRSIGELALSVRHAGSSYGVGIDPRLIEGGLVTGPAAFQAAASPGTFHQETGAPEGAMLPPAMSQAIWQIVFSDPLLELLTVEPSDTPAVDIIKDETTPWGATGVQASWRAEGVQMTPATLVTKTTQCRAQELYAFVLATGEILDDIPRLNDRLAVKAPAAIRWKLVESFMFGTGAGQPLGWAHANYPGRLLVTRTTAAQVKPDDFVNMFAKILVSDGPDNSFWVVNRDTLPDIILRSVVGNIPIWMPPSGLAGAPQGTILGRPLFYSEHCQTKGTAGDVQYVNPDGYYIMQRGPAKFDVSIHLFFDQNISAFRWMVRFGGQPLLSAVVAPAKGANSKSHFVILNT